MPATLTKQGMDVLQWIVCAAALLFIAAIVCGTL